MRAITRYFWKAYYWLRPVGRQSTKTDYVRAACRIHGIKMIEHPVVRPEPVDYRGLGWTGVTESKICVESSCNHVYVPDANGKCPKCGSEGMWISNTVIGNRAEDRAGVSGLPKAVTSRRAAEEWDKYFQRQEAKDAALRKAKGVLKWEE